MRAETLNHTRVNLAFSTRERLFEWKHTQILYPSTAVMPGSMDSSFANSSSTNFFCKACPLSLSTFGPLLQVVSVCTAFKVRTYSAILQSIKNAPCASTGRSGLTASTIAAPPVAVERASMRIMMRSMMVCSHGFSSRKRLLWHMPGVAVSNMTFDSDVTGLRLAISRMA
jgi:hypothetical protein